MCSSYESVYGSQLCVIEINDGQVSSSRHMDDENISTDGDKKNSN